MSLLDPWTSLASPFFDKCRVISGSSRSHQFYQAVALGHYDEVERLYKEGVDPDDPILVEDQLTSPIYAAVIRRDPKMVRMLLDYKVNVNTSIVKGLTPIIIAAFRGLEDIFTMLCDAGASFYSVTPGFILVAAIQSGSVPIFRRLIDGGVPYDKPIGLVGPRMYNCDCCGHKKKKSKHDIKEIDVTTWVWPLTLCVSYKQVEMTRDLLQRGVDVNYSTIANGSPLCEAVLQHSKELVELLLEYGALLTTFKTINHKRFRPHEIAASYSTDSSIFHLLMDHWSRY